MEMHSHLTLAAGYDLFRELNEYRFDCHLVVGQPDGLKAEAFTKRLKPRQIARVFRFDHPVVLPEIIPFGIDRDDKRWFFHNEPARQNS